MPMEYAQVDPFAATAWSTEEVNNAKEVVSAGEEFSAAMHQENLTFAAITELTSQGNIPGGAPDPEYNVWDNIKEEHVNHWDAYNDVGNEEQRQYVEAKLDAELERREVLERGGGSAIGYSMLAALIDPVMWPAAAAPWVRGATVAGKAGIGASAAITEAAIAETGLQGLQEARTPYETMMAIGGAGLLGGMLGGAVGTFSGKQFIEIANSMAAEAESMANGGIVKLDGAVDEVQPRMGLDAAGATNTERYIAPVKTYGTRMLSPLLRGLSSGSRTMRDFTDRMLDHNLELRGADGNPIPAHTDTAQMWQSKEFHRILGDVVRTQNKGYKAARAAGFSGKRHEFEDVVGMMLARDNYTISGYSFEVGKQIADSARAIRKHIDEVSEIQKSKGILDADAKPLGAPVYRPRKYNVDYIKQNEAAFLNLLRTRFREMGNLSPEDVQELQKLGALREKLGLNEQGAARWKELREKQLRGLSEDQADIDARATLRKIYGEEAGLIPRWAETKQDGIEIPGSSHLRQRVLALTDEELMPYLVNNASELMESWLRSTLPEIGILRASGVDSSIDQYYKRIIAGIDRDYDALTSGKTGKAAEKLNNRRVMEKDDARMLINAMMGRHGTTTAYGNKINKVGAAVRGAIFMAQLGMMTLSAIPDMARPITEFGLRRYLRAFGPNIMDGFKATMADSTSRMNGKWLQKVGSATDLLINSRVWALNPEMDSMGRKMRKATSEFSKLTGMTGWNTIMKTMTGNLAVDSILEAAETAVRKTAAKGRVDKAIRQLYKVGIDEDLAEKILKEFDRSGETSGLRIANVDNWKDEDAIEAFTNAVRTEVDTVIVTPGVGDRPFFINKEAGKYLLQFKSFALGAHNQMFLPMMQKFGHLASKEAKYNLEVMNGLLVGMSLGVASSYLRAAAKGDTERLDGKSLQWWIREALDRTGAASVAFEVYGGADRLLGGTLSTSLGFEEQGYRRFRRSNWETFAGPTFGYGERAFSLIGALNDGQITASEIHSMRKMLPLQNWVLTARLFNSAEEAVVDYFGLPKRAR